MWYILQVMESMPEMSYKEVMAEMGRAWNGLTDEEKSPFLLQHKQPLESLMSQILMETLIPIF